MFFRRKSHAVAPYRVLMVCMGNICRSPTAEGVLRRMLVAARLEEQVEVDSAGTFGGHAGAPPDLRAQEHAQARGYDLSALRARQIAVRDFERFDLILTMDRDNQHRVQRLKPGDAARAEVRLLLEFGRDPQRPQEVPDPYYGGADDFERVLDLVEDACRGLIDELRLRVDQRRAPDIGTS
jgi:protein-tyrosine phosphatase